MGYWSERLIEIEQNNREYETEEYITVFGFSAEDIAFGIEGVKHDLAKRGMDPHQLPHDRLALRVLNTVGEELLETADRDGFELLTIRAVIEGDSGYLDCEFSQPEAHRFRRHVLFPGEEAR